MRKSKLSQERKHQDKYMRLKRELVQQTATRLNTTTQNIVMAYKDLIGNHLYDDKLEYIREQMEFLDIENIEPRFQTKKMTGGQKILIDDYLQPESVEDHEHAITENKYISGLKKRSRIL